jgi:nucleoside-diphosphate-sugar epimerase
MNQVIDTIANLTRPIDVVRLPAQRGDVRHTAADTTAAREGFGYAPRVSLADGLARMVESARNVFAIEAA